MRRAVLLLACLSACGPDGLPPPGPTAGLAPAGADPGVSGVSGEAGSGNRGALTDPDGPGRAAVPLGGPAAGAVPNAGP